MSNHSVKSILADSVSISISALGKTEASLSHRDEFGNFFQLNEGEQKIKIPCLLYDENGIWYNLNRPKKVVFTKLSIDYWSVNAEKDADYTNALNFTIEFRKKAIDKISSEDRSPETAYFTPTLIKNTAEREIKIKADKDKRVDFLKEYAAKNKLSATQTEALEKILVHEIAALDFYGLRFNLSNFSPKYLAEKISMANLKDTTSLYDINYQRFVYMASVIIIESETKSNKHQLLEDYAIITKKFEGKVKDYLLTRILNEKEIYENIAEADFQSAVKMYDKDCQTAEYKAYINKGLKVNIPDLAADEVMGLDQKKIKLSTILKGNLTYIDFWASWCSPCKAEMPFSRKIEKEYSKKGIKFIYISMDESPAPWEKASNQIGLSDSYLLPQGKESSIVKQFNINSIPRYMIMDKEGKITDQDAPRPSDSKIRGVFDKLLGKSKLELIKSHSSQYTGKTMPSSGSLPLKSLAILLAKLLEINRNKPFKSEIPN